ncbi:hypothetical protein [Microbacterium sp. NPDC057650]|uniref:hypothetical protein n=1 Tax=unclassified Microbacterium TaxID=2609290 RepID=UPI0036725FF9
MRIIRTAAAIAAVLALSFGATACSIRIADGAAPSATDKRAAGDADASAKEDSPAPAESDAGSAPDRDGVTRDDLIAEATRTLRCDGELTMLDDAVIVRVEGSCDRLILNTTGSQVIADDVALLEVIGDGNLVLSGVVDELLVNGTGNVVHWTGATPKVSDVGSSNTLTAG